MFSLIEDHVCEVLNGILSEIVSVRGFHFGFKDIEVTKVVNGRVMNGTM